MPNDTSPLRPLPSSALARPVRPGWPEIGVGLVALVATTAILPLINSGGTGVNPVLWGLILTAWSGVVGLVGFAAAALIRIRSWAAFGVRRTTWRWLLLAVPLGVLAFLLKGVVNAALVALFGPIPNPQGPYYDAAGGGLLPLVLTFVFFAVLTPIGEEFLFRGVIANALLRYGPVVGVVGSSAIFALAHGFNIALPSALVVGLVLAEVMRRSGSVWPGVIIHGVNNLGLPILVLILGADASV